MHPLRARLIAALGLPVASLAQAGCAPPPRDGSLPPASTAPASPSASPAATTAATASPPPAASHGAPASSSPGAQPGAGLSPCKVDQARELLCGVLASGTSPAGNCPEVKGPAVAMPKVTRFGDFNRTRDPSPNRLDPKATEADRKSSGEPLSCCYAYCSDMPVRAKADPNGPGSPVTLCFAPPERGTSAPGPDPLAHCPAALAVPYNNPGNQAVALDLGSSLRFAKERGEPLCCYTHNLVPSSGGRPLLLPGGPRLASLDRSRAASSWARG